MLKMNHGVSLIVLSLTGLSNDTFSFIEHKNHSISLTDGTSAVETLQNILDKVTEQQNFESRSMAGVEAIIRKIKTTIGTRTLPAELKTLVDNHLSTGRTMQEVSHQQSEILARIAGEVKTLLPWAKKFDEPEATEEVTASAPAAAEPEPSNVSDTVKMLLEELEAEGWAPVRSEHHDHECKFCGGDHETPELFNGKVSVKQLADRFPNIAKLFEQGTKGKEYVGSGARDANVIKDFLSGMILGYGKEDTPADLPEDLMAVKASQIDMAALAARSKVIPGTKMRYIDGTIPELAKMFKISEEEMMKRVQPIPAQH